MTDFSQQPFVSSRIQRMKRRALLQRLYPIILFILILILIAIVFNFKAWAFSKVTPQTVHAQENIASASATPIIVIQEDERVKILQNFLNTKNSPLTAYSEYFIQISDKYGLDWTLMPAIAGMESNFGHEMPKGSNNPFGLGGGKLMTFATLYDSIAFEGQLLSTKYKLTANHAIGSIYCPSSECNQNWAVIVTNFSEEILK